MFDERYMGFRSYVEGREPTKGLAMFVDRYLSTTHRDGIESGCPLPSLSSDVARLPLAARRRFAAGAERLTQGIANVLRELGKADPRGLACSAHCVSPYLARSRLWRLSEYLDYPLYLRGPHWRH
jgi:TetR/AcrR family transcriptional repressor of nem operon